MFGFFLLCSKFLKEVYGVLSMQYEKVRYAFIVCRQHTKNLIQKLTTYEERNELLIYFLEKWKLGYQNFQYLIHNITNRPLVKFTMTDNSTFN